MMTTRQEHQPHRRHLSLRARMNGQYWRIARRRRVLCFLFQIFRDDLIIYPLQLEETITHLKALRRAVSLAQQFYSGLSPQSMKLLQPWGTITKLGDFERQVTELLLCVASMQKASKEGQIFLCVQMHVVIRRLFPAMLTSFEDLTSQLGALLEKVQDRRAYE